MSATKRSRRSSQNDLSSGSRICVAIGAIALLVANLLPLGGGKGPLLVIGEVFVIVGIIGMGIGALVNAQHKKSRGQKRR